MKKGFCFIIIAISAAALPALASNWDDISSGGFAFAGTGVDAGFMWASMTSGGVSWVPGETYDGIPTGANVNAGYMARVGPIHAGIRAQAVNATYVTGVALDSFGIQRDQAMADFTIDALAAFTGVSWLYPYAFAGASLSYYSYFDPGHPTGGVTLYSPGLRAGAGLALVPFAFDIGSGSLRILAGPEVVYGASFPYGPLFTYLRVQGFITAQFFSKPSK